MHASAADQPPAAAVLQAKREPESEQERRQETAPVPRIGAVPSARSEAAQLLSAAGVDGGTEDALAAAYPLPRIQAVIADARQRGKSAGWIVAALRGGYGGRPSPALPRASPAGDAGCNAAARLAEERQAHADRAVTLARLAERRQLEAERAARSAADERASARQELAAFQIVLARCPEEAERPWAQAKLRRLELAAAGA
jgi:cell division septum initiation protein DivIVA